MNQTVAEVLHVLCDELRDNSIVVATELEAHVPPVEADRVQVQQTLINLVHNAIEAMADVPGRGESAAVQFKAPGGRAPDSSS